jgi:Spy/CpxP family protein refolding chaperone
MKRTRWVALVAALALASGLAGARQRGRRRGAEPEESLYDQLLRECKLTGKQQADVKAKMKARDDALAAWDQANAEKMEAAEAAAKDARSGGDADARKKASSALRALRTAREESAAQASAAVLAVLTPEQKAAWDGYQLFQSVAGRYRRAELTEEQLAKIKVGCALAAKELAELGDEDGKAKRARRDVTTKLRWGIDAFVLTPEQREALARQPARRGRKAKDEP